MTPKEILIKEITRLIDIEQALLEAGKEDEAKVYTRIAKKINFMIIREHSKERRKKLETSELDSAVHHGR